MKVKKTVLLTFLVGLAMIVCNVLSVGAGLIGVSILLLVGNIPRIGEPHSAAFPYGKRVRVTTFRTRARFQTLRELKNI